MCTFSVDHLYSNIIGDYWPPERGYVDAAYTMIPFPFEEPFSVPAFAIEREYTFDDLINYLSTWSGVKNFIRSNQIDPLIALKKEINEMQIRDKIPAYFKLNMRIEKIITVPYMMGPKLSKN